VDRILAGTAGTVEVLNYDSDGPPANAGVGDGSAAVTDSAGVAIAGSPFTATNVSTGLYRFQLPAALTTLDTYSVAWTMPDATTRASEFELVGSFIFTIASLRAFDTALANASTYPAAAIRDARELVEDRFERAAGVSFTLRGRREVIDGSGRSTLWLDERLISRLVHVKVSGTVQTGVTFDEHGKLTGSFPAGVRNVEVLYEHGHMPTPAPIHDAAKRYAREMLVKGAFDDLSRATGIQTELGFYRITQAGKERPTGIPDVDAVLAAYDRHMPNVG
jgi:hypothetical protein